MASIFQDRDRIVFPRWRDFKSTSQSGDIRPFLKEPVRAFSKDDLELKIQAWNEEHNFSNATELINSAYNLGLKQYSLEAAEFVVASGRNIPSGIRKIVNLTLDYGEIEETPIQEFTFDRGTVNQYFHDQIALLRKRISYNMYNAILWVELGRLHAIVSNIEKAERALLVALHLAPENRYVIRSLARFCVHSKQPEKALYYLNRNPMTRHDPWLLSTQIAVYELVKNKVSLFVKNGFNLLDSSKFNAFDKNELASSLGTLEFNHGELKNARKLFKQSLICPNDNSVAQASWASKRMNGLLIQKNSLALPCAFEARAINFFHQGKYREALAESIKWLLDEPFASRPARLSSHLASTYVADFRLASELARFAMQNTPENFDLINSLAYSLCLEDKPLEAETIYSKINSQFLNAKEHIAFIATSGLIQYRKNNFEEGRILYQQAIVEAKELGDDYLYKLALVNFYREEVRANPDIKEQIEPLLKNLKETAQEKQIQVERERIEQRLSGQNTIGSFTLI